MKIIFLFDVISVNDKSDESSKNLDLDLDFAKWIIEIAYKWSLVKFGLHQT